MPNSDTEMADATEEPSLSAAARLASLPELVEKILRFARKKELADRPVHGNSVNAVPKDAKPPVLCSALAVSRAWAACAEELLLEHLEINSPTQLFLLLKCIAMKRRRLAGRKRQRSGQSGAQRNDHWEAPFDAPLRVKTLDFSRWMFQRVSRSEFINKLVTVPDIWREQKNSAKAINAAMLSLAAELAEGTFLRGCVTSILFPSLDYKNSSFDSTTETDVSEMPEHSDFTDLMDFEVTRFFFLSPETFASLLDASMGSNSPSIDFLSCSHDIGIPHLLHAADKGLLSNVKSLSLNNNLARFFCNTVSDNLAEFLIHRKTIENPPTFHRSALDLPPAWLERTPMSVLQNFFAALKSLTELDLGATASLMALFSCLFAPALRSVSCKANRAVPPANEGFDPSYPHLNEQCIEMFLKLAGRLTHLDAEIALGNLAVTTDAFEQLTAGLFRSSLEVLKLSYTQMFRDVIGEGMYDPVKTPRFLSRVVGRAAATLTTLHLELPSREVPLNEADFSVCTALQDISIKVLGHYGNPRFPGKKGLKICPGAQFRGSQETLKKLVLYHVTVLRVDLLSELEEVRAKGDVVLRADSMFQFSALEELFLSSVDFAQDPVLLWLGQCPKLSKLEVHSPFRVPKCSFVGNERMRLVRSPNGEKERIVLDMGFIAPSLQLAYGARLRWHRLDEIAVRSIEPLMPSVSNLALGSYFGHSASISNRALARLLEKAERLEVLDVSYRVVDPGTLKAIAGAELPRLRELVIDSDRLRKETGWKWMRLSALVGFLKKMGGKYLTGTKEENRNRLRIKFRMLCHYFLENPYKEFVEMNTDPGRRGDIKVSKARHAQEFYRQRDEVIRTVKELGIKWLSDFLEPELGSDMERQFRG